MIKYSKILFAILIPFISMAQHKGFKATYKVTRKAHVRKNKAKDMLIKMYPTLKMKDSVLKPRIEWTGTLTSKVDKAVFSVERQRPAKNDIIHKYAMFKDIKTNKLFFQETWPKASGIKKFAYEINLNFYKWKLTNETKQIGDFKCKKAIGINKFNEEVVCWFTDELGVVGAPKYFDGLPGLVVEVVVKNGLHSFKLEKLSFPDKITLEEKGTDHNFMTIEEFRNKEPTVWFNKYKTSKHLSH